MRIIDADELIEKYSGGGFYTAAHVRVSINATPTVIQTWRNVADGEFPKDNESVLVYCETTGGIIKSTYHELMKDGKRVYYSFGGQIRKYWMPLPKPPKNEGDA